MKCIAIALVLFSYLSTSLSADGSLYQDEIEKWRATREEKLRADNGWLTLAGRFPLKEGANTFGTAKNNDIVFPAGLEGDSTERIGTLNIDSSAKEVTLLLTKGVTMLSEGEPFTGKRAMGTVPGKRDWVTLGRLSFHIIERNGKYVLRLADNQSLVRKNFPGCAWYLPNEAFKVEAKFVPYPEGKMLSIVNIIDEISEQPCAGYAEFELNGTIHKLDAIKEGDGLFFVFRDSTAGDTTYPPARFLDIEQQPGDNATFTLDFNKAYNPPCAFSEFTTCPLPPKQNILKSRIEAGEKYRPK